MQQDTASVPPGRLTFCLMQKTHSLTPRLMVDAARAKQQILSHGGIYHLVYWSDDDPNRQLLHAANILSLKAHLGEAHVIPVNNSQIEAAPWPGVLKRMRGNVPNVLQRLGWKRKPQKWQWRACDVPDHLWYRNVRSTLPAWVTHIWVMEYDVSWTGNLPGLLAMLSDNTSDWIAPRPGPAAPRWHAYRDHNWLQDLEVWQNLVTLVRYSSRLLDAIAKNLQEGRHQYCEITGITTCMVNLTAPACCVGNYSDSPALGHGLGDDVARSLFSFNTAIDVNLWRELTDRDASESSSHLYHAVKC